MKIEDSARQALDRNPPPEQGVLRDPARRPGLALQPGSRELRAAASASEPPACQVPGHRRRPRRAARDRERVGYRIVQEALTNSLKYAGPARAEGTVGRRTQDGAVTIEVADDGPGKPSAPALLAGREAADTGLREMRKERAAACSAVSLRRRAAAPAAGSPCAPGCRWALGELS